MSKTDEDTIMKFPCEFPIKVMGIASDDFDIIVTNIIKKHIRTKLKNEKINANTCSNTNAKTCLNTNAKMQKINNK